MPTGSAQGRRAGPAPDPNALRRDRKDDQAEWITLPAVGRDGPAPEWPLSGAIKREKTIWNRLWAMPQAVEWERQELELTVALYVRRLIIAEKRNCPATAVNTVRQLAESLGLTTPGLRANRWKIGDPPKPTENRGDAGDAEVVPMRPRVVADAVEGA